MKLETQLATIRHASTVRTQPQPNARGAALVLYIKLTNSEQTMRVEMKDTTALFNSFGVESYTQMYGAMCLVQFNANVIVNIAPVTKAELDGAITYNAWEIAHLTSPGTKAVFSSDRWLYDLEPKPYDPFDL